MTQPERSKNSLPQARMALRVQSMHIQFDVDWISGGASAAKEPGHFEVRTSSSQVTRMHFFPQKIDDLFSRRPQRAKAANAAEIVSLSK